MATTRDLDELALALPRATREVSGDGRPEYRVDGKLFCIQGTPSTRRRASGSTTY